jgi:uncharacterized protein (TIGR02271 family)
MANAVVGVYDDFTQAQAALNELIDSGFPADQARIDPSGETSQSSYSAGEQKETGISGSIAGFFRSLVGSREHEQERHADVYSEAVRRGSYVVSVRVQSDEESVRATEIMHRYDPVDIDERAAHWQSQGWSGYDMEAPAYSREEIQQERLRYASGRSSGREDETTIPVIQEELKVGKREVERSRVRIIQHIVETPVEEEVLLREEHVSVERRPVDQPATQAEVAAMQDSSFEVRETAEEAVVSKTARVVEEVVVGKDTTQRTKKVSDKVRHTEVDVEKAES